MNLTENKIQNQHKIILIIIGIVFSSLAVYYFIIPPTIKKIIKLKNDILIQKINFEKNLDENKNLGKTSEQFKQIQPDLQKFENTSIDKNKKLEFITILENAATQNNIIQKINMEPIDDKKSNQKIKLDITLSANFTNFLKYLSTLNQMDNYININSIEIDRLASPRISENKEENDNLHIKINADTYWR